MTDTAIYCNIHKRSDVNSCQVCEDENPILKRYFTAQVSISQLDLTDREQCSIEDGWKDIEKEISQAIRQPQVGRYRTPFQITFDEWDYQDCPLCFKPSDPDGTPHKECTDREQAQADRETP